VPPLPPPPKSSAPVLPEKADPKQRRTGFFIWLFIRLITFTIRRRWIDRSGINDKSCVIYALWHSRLFFCLVAILGHCKLRGHPLGMAALISASRDGALLSDVFERFGVVPVRGSSSRRGAQALRELTTAARRGYNLGLTPDGPRGPARIAQDGVIAMAQLTGFPIVPFTCEIGWKFRLKSWDRFQIPFPFTRVDFIFAEPIRVPRDASPELREQLRLQLERTLNEITPDPAG